MIQVRKIACRELNRIDLISCKFFAKEFANFEIDLKGCLRVVFYTIRESM
jgi:hypothetical protein